MGSNKKLDPDEEIPLESDMDVNDMGDLDDLEVVDNDELSLDEEPPGSQVLQSTSKRVRMIFSVMASPNRIDILRILNSKGPLTYSELKSLAGFKSKKESGKFAYHLRKLLRQSLVALNKSERRYTITNLGKLVLSLARQIEERSIIEGGKMYVRTSHDSIEEFNTQKIIQSLVREGSLPLELAQKITEEVENRIYKYQTTYLTGSLIRELVNSVLLEHGHEEYRHKLARVGLPIFEVQEMMSNAENVDNGVEGLLFKTGQIVFAEHLLTSTLPKDIADAHLSGDIHITNLGLWSILPDTIFINVKTLVEDGIDLKGKSLGVCRVPSVKTLNNLSSALSMIIALISKEASQEVVVDDLIPLLSRYPKDLHELERKLVDSFTTSSIIVGYSKMSTVVSFRIPLGAEQKIVKTVLSAYKTYAKLTPIPRIGLIIDYEKGRITDVSEILSEIITLGGKVMFAKHKTSQKGITCAKNSTSTVLHLGSLSINLPRLAFESNKDETYFRARLALLMKPTLDSLALRKKSVSNLIRLGVNPILAANTHYMQRSVVSLVINLTGLQNAVYGILGFKANNKGGQEILHKVIETAVDIASKKDKDLGINIIICMTETDGSERFIALDSRKYGKDHVQQIIDAETYSQGIVFDIDKLSSLTGKSAEITECNKIGKILNGGLLIQITIPKGTKAVEIKKVIEKGASITSSFKPVMQVPICGNCGFKDEKLGDKCPACKSTYFI
uniref:Regulatory protein ArsR (NrdD) n=1 Tax=uncultured marine thaumarchaeote KM3_46_G12 TaxID=1456162 RepID=A0A075H858_9ARCH|nr:regulatory protein ArsR (nrdD) [uncultured marine thaumarchaeote KM3_46_G12]